MCLSKSHPSRQETMQIQNQIYAPEVRFKWNLHALIHRATLKILIYSLETHTRSPVIIQVLQTCFSMHVQKDHSLIRTEQVGITSHRLPAEIFSGDALLLCSPKGTFGKVRQRKTQHWLLLSFKDTAWSGKRQCSAFLHELVRPDLS